MTRAGNRSRSLLSDSPQKMVRVRYKRGADRYPITTKTAASKSSNPAPIPNSLIGLGSVTSGHPPNMGTKAPWYWTSRPCFLVCVSRPETPHLLPFDSCTCGGLGCLNAISVRASFLVPQERLLLPSEKYALLARQTVGDQENTRAEPPPI